jgi:hypothetical protein
MRFREGAHPFVVSMLALAFAACTNDYGSLDFSGVVERAEAGPNGSGGETVSTGGGGGSGGGTSGDASVGTPESGAGGTVPGPEGSAEAGMADAGSDGSVESGATDAEAPDGSGDAAPTCSDRYGAAAGFTLAPIARPLPDLADSLNASQAYEARARKPRFRQRDFDLMTSGHSDTARSPPLKGLPLPGTSRRR